MEFFFPLLAQNTRNAAWMAAWLWTIRTWSLWFYLLCIYTLSFLLWNMSFYFYVLRHVVVVLFHQCVSCRWISFPDYFWLLDTRTRSRLPLSIGALSFPSLPCCVAQTAETMMTNESGAPLSRPLSSLAFMRLILPEAAQQEEPWTVPKL